MAEQTLSELVMNLINWIESLHEKNLKLAAKVESLERDLEKAASSKEELEAQLSAYQNSDRNTLSTVPTGTIGSQITTNIHPQQQQAIYQQVANPPTFVTQPAPYVWAYDTSGHDMQVPYYEHYGAQAFHQP